MSQQFWKEWEEEVAADPVEISGISGVLGVRWSPELNVRKVVIYNSDGRALAIINPSEGARFSWSPIEWGIEEVLSFYFVMFYSAKGVLLRRALV